MLHVPTLPRRYAHTHDVNSAVCIVTRLRMPTMEKQKAETPTQLRGWDERETSEPLHTYGSLSVSPCILVFHVCQFYSPATSHKPFFVLSFISTTRVHCILDKTYAYKMHRVCIDLTLSLSIPPTTQLRLAPSDDHHLSSCNTVCLNCW